MNKKPYEVGDILALSDDIERIGILIGIYRQYGGVSSPKDDRFLVYFFHKNFRTIGVGKNIVDLPRHFFEHLDVKKLIKQ